MVIKSSRVQTYVVGKVTAYLSKELNREVKIGFVDIEFIKTLVLKEVLVRDHKSDTLLYVQELSIDLNEFKTDSLWFGISDLKLSNARFYMVKYLGEEEDNLTQLLNEIVPPSKDSSAVNYRIKCNSLELKNLTFKFQDWNDTTKGYGIDYSNLFVNRIKLNAENVYFNQDSIYAQVNNISLKDRSGFTVENMTSVFSLTDKKLNLANLSLKTEKSDISTDLSFEYEEYADFSDFLKKVKINFDADTSELHLSDLAYFVPDLEGADYKVLLSGKIKGRVAKLKGENVYVRFGPNSDFDGDFIVSGLPNIDETFLQLDINSLSSHINDLKKIPIPPFKEKGLLEFPKEMDVVGKIDYTGTFTGFFTDFVAYGKLNTSIGSLSTDIKLSKDFESDKYHYNGRLTALGFQLGRFIQDPNFGVVNFNLRVDGMGITKEDVSVFMEGKIQDFNYSGYDYKDIDVAGKLSAMSFEGQLCMQDENILMDYSGFVNFGKSIPEFNFISNVGYANLYALHLTDSFPDNAVSGYINAKFSGNKLDNLKGSIEIEDLVYTENKKSFAIEKMKLISEFDKEGNKKIEFTSDVLDAGISGKFITSELPQSANYIVSKALPSFYGKKIEKPKTDQHFDYYVKGNELLSVTSVLLPDLLIKDTLFIKGNYQSSSNTITLQSSVSSMTYQGKEFNHPSLNLTAYNDVIDIDASLSRLTLADSVFVDNLAISCKAINNHIQFESSWSSSTSKDYSGELSGLLVINGSNKFEVQFYPSTLLIAQNEWKLLEGNSIFIDSTNVLVNGLSLQNGEQRIDINGKVSHSKTDKLFLNVESFDLSALNQIFKGTDMGLKGTLNGKAFLSDPYAKMFFNADFLFDSLEMNGSKIGNGAIRSDYDVSKNQMVLDGMLGKFLSFDGVYEINKKEGALDVNLTVEDFELMLLEPFIKEYITDIEGTISGKVKLKGTSENPLLSGILLFKESQLRINYLNTLYFIDNEKLVIGEDWFGLNGIKITDDKGNKAKVTATVFHESFSNMNFDVSIETERFNFLNTSASDNSLYYGTAFLSGNVNVGGYTENLLIEVTGKTEKGTQLFVPLSGPTEVGSADFITFVTKGSTLDVKKETTDLSGIQMEFNLEMTPDAEVQLIFDEKIGDIMRGRGKGDITLEINTLGTFNMYGTYLITEGDYLFTLQNVINKKFHIAEGSTIEWNGSVYDADINLDAVYKVRTAPYPIMSYLGDTNAIYKKRVPVETHLLLTQKLMNPSLAFNIDLPSLDAGSQSLIKNFLNSSNSQQEMNKQVFSLLILNQFTPPQGRSGGALQQASSASGADLLSNQVSNWLSQVSKDFDMGVKWSAGDEVSTQEVELALSTQLFNDRVTFETNLGVGGTTRSSTSDQNNFVGDFKIEYKISEDGKLKSKVFNRTNDYNQLNNNGRYTQGAGIFYTGEFDRFRDLFKRKDKEKPKS